MKIYNLKRQLILPIGLKEAWDFFSSPNNLKEITPSFMDFRISSKVPEDMYPGLIITYSVRPFGNLPITWVSEITQMRNLDYFIDEQRFGPYKFWHHLHQFKELPEGTLVTDFVNYGLPFGMVGRMAHRLFLKHRLNHIFDYRGDRLLNLFGKAGIKPQPLKL